MREHAWIVLFQLMWIHHHQCIIYATEEITVDDEIDYTGYSVFRIIPQNEEDLKYLQTLMEREEPLLDFWKSPTAVERAVDVMVPPDKSLIFGNTLADRKIPGTIIIPDVAKLLLRKQELHVNKPLSPFGRDINVFFNDYRKLFEIHGFLDQLTQHNPNITSTFSIGKSVEGNDLKAIKIGSQSLSGSKPAIWIDGGIHAREWISPSTAAFIADSLVTEYNVNQDVRELVDYFDWYILPVINPDGYNYSHSVNRLWRKTRKRFDECSGVDLNRNFGFHWIGGGASRMPCSETFAGEEEFSEPESKALAEFLLKHKDNFKAYLALHSYSQLWMTPWGWSSELPKDYDQMLAVAQEGVNALTAVHGTKYEVGSSTNILYVAAGGSDDWAYGVAGIKYSYTLELRDTGRYGFVLPPDQIIPTGEETWAGIKAMAKAIKKQLHV